MQCLLLSLAGHADDIGLHSNAAIAVYWFYVMSHMTAYSMAVVALYLHCGLAYRHPCFCRSVMKRLLPLSFVQYASEIQLV